MNQMGHEMVWNRFGRITPLIVGLALVGGLSIHTASAETRTPQVPTLKHVHHGASATLEMIVFSFGIDATAHFLYGTKRDLAGASKTRAHSIKGSPHGTYSRRKLKCLKRGTVYYYRGVTTNRNGTSMTGVKSFKTSETHSNNLVKRAWHWKVTATTAVLSMTLGPPRSRTKVYFRYHTKQDLTEARNTRVAYKNASCIGSGHHPSLKNLKPATTYYYQAVAQNQSGTYGSRVMSFTTK